MASFRAISVGVAMVLVVAACGGNEEAVEAETSAVSRTTITAIHGSSASGDTAADPEASPTEAYAIVDTGQATCYDDTGAVTCPLEDEAFFGQDGNYAGTQPAYVDNGDGTVTDLATGLMWQQDPGDKMTYAEAVADADSFELAGYGDWRLPTIKELYSLIDFSGVDPSGCQPGDDCETTPFIDTDSFDFEYGDTDAGERLIDSQWATSTVYVGTTMGGDETMFGVNFADGRIKGYPMSDPQGGEMNFFVIYVRGNADYGTNDFVDNGDGTVSDLATGLIWQQTDSGTGMEWSDALGHCEALDLAGSDDWRLPNAKELHSIVDYTRSPSTTGSAAIDPVFSASAIVDEGGEIDFGFYWTGTTHASLTGGTSAVYVAFGEALGWMQSPQAGEYALLDVHGAGAQRSDPKTGDAADYPYGHGPQGDVIRIENLVRCVRGGDSETVSGGEVVEHNTATPAESPQGSARQTEGGPLAEAAQMLGVTEEQLAAALGDPAAGPPDFDAAARELGMPVEELMDAVGPPPGTGGG
jgi:hypothetical protein